MSCPILFCGGLYIKIGIKLGIWSAPLFALILPLAGPDGAVFLSDEAPTASGEVAITSTSWSIIAPARDLERADGNPFLTPQRGMSGEFSMRLHPAAPESPITLETYEGGVYYARTSAAQEERWGAVHEIPSRRAEPLNGTVDVRISCEDECLVVVEPQARGATLRYLDPDARDLPLLPPDLPIPTVAVPGIPGPPAPAEDPLGAAWDTARGTVEVTGAVRILVWSATVTIVDGNGDRHLEAGELPSGTTELLTPFPAGAERRERRAIALAADALDGEVAPSPSGSWTLTALAPTYDIDGALTFELARGDLRYGETARAVDARRIEAEGTFRVTPECAKVVPREVAEPGCRYEVAGSVNRVAVGGHLVFTRPTPASVGLAFLLAAAVALAERLVEATRVLFASLQARIRGPRALDHPQRARLHALFQERRALHFNEIIRLTGLPAGSLTHHLKVLAGAGLVRSRTVGSLRFYWLAASGLSEAESARIAALSSERARRYARRILDAPGITQIEIADRERVYRGNVSYHLRKLIASGLVEAERDREARCVRYRPTRWLEEALSGHARGDLGGAPG